MISRTLLAVLWIASSLAQEKQPKAQPSTESMNDVVRAEIQTRLGLMRQEIATQLRQEIRQELKPELKQELKQEIKQELRSELKSEIESDLRLQMRR